MLKSAAIYLFSLVFTVNAQEFIPHDELLRPDHVKYILSKKIETEKSGFYSTGKDGIPSGKALRRSSVSYSPKGLVQAVTFRDSTGISVDSFYYDKTGSVDRIVTFRGNNDSTAMPVSRCYFRKDTTGKIAEVQLYDLATATVTEVYGYIYTKPGKLTAIRRVLSTDSTALDSLLWQFDKNEKLIAKINRDRRTEYKYDQTGNLLETRDFTGKSVGNTTKFSYDNNRRLIKTTTSGKGYNSVSEYLYNKNGILILIKTKADRGTKGSETYFTELREVGVYK